MKRFLRHLIGFAYNRIMRPTVKIPFDAWVNRDVSLGTCVQLGKKSKIYDSKLGDHVRISAHCGVSGSILLGHNNLGSRCGLYDVKMGRYSYAGDRTNLIDIEIGNFCSISSEVVCGYDHVLHPLDNISTHPAFYGVQKNDNANLGNQQAPLPRGRRITVGNDALIGYRALVREGVKIGNGAVVGAGALVTRDVPDYAIVAGMPAKIIRYRFSEKIIAQLLKIQWWNWDDKSLCLAGKLLAQNDPELLFNWVRDQGL